MDRELMQKQRFMLDACNALEAAIEANGMDPNAMPSVERAAVSAAVSRADRRKNM